MLSLLPKSVSRHAWTSKSLLLLRSARDTRPAWHVCTYGGNQGPGHQQQPASHVSTGNGIYQQAPSVPSPPTPQAAAQGPVASGAQVPTAAPPSEHVPLEEVRNDTYVQNKVTLIGKSPMVCVLGAGPVRPTAMILTQVWSQCTAGRTG